MARFRLPGKRDLLTRMTPDGFELSMVPRGMAGPLDGVRSNFPQITLDQFLQSFSYGGLQYPFIPQMTIVGNKETVAESFGGYVQGAYRSNGVVFACMLVRMLVFSEARFQWRHMYRGKPQDLWGDAKLQILEHPWKNAVTGDLLARAIQDVDLAGNAFFLRRNNKIRRMRPDWVTIILGNDDDPRQEFVSGDLDADVLGYIYYPGGGTAGTGQSRPPEFLGADEVAHFAPIPDPVAQFRGMSWLTPMIREVLGDSAATSHKLKFFENGATVNGVVALDKSIQKEAFDKWIEVFKTQHEGVLNAYRTLYLGGGADYKVIGSDFKQMDFKVTQGAGESRIAAAAGVPAIIVGFSEGLAAGTYSNYQQARRRFADATMRPMWRNFCGSLETIVPPPGGSQLWYDERDIAFLREDRLDQANIQHTEASTISVLVTAGFDPNSIVDAVVANDFTKLSHTGLYSVQLQPPGTGTDLDPDAVDATGQPILDPATKQKLLTAGGAKPAPIPGTAKSKAQQLDDKAPKQLKAATNDDEDGPHPNDSAKATKGKGEK